MLHVLRRAGVAVIAALIFASPVLAQAIPPYQASKPLETLSGLDYTKPATALNPVPFFYSLKSYQLLGTSGGAGASATGSAVAITDGGRSMIWTCSGTFSGATLTLRARGPDGSTVLAVDTMTAATQKLENIGPGAILSVAISGATGTPSLFCTIG